MNLKLRSCVTALPLFVQPVVFEMTDIRVKGIRRGCNWCRVSMTPVADCFA